MKYGKVIFSLMLAPKIWATTTSILPATQSMQATGDFISGPVAFYAVLALIAVGLLDYLRTRDLRAVAQDLTVIGAIGGFAMYAKPTVAAWFTAGAVI